MGVSTRARLAAAGAALVMAGVTGCSPVTRAAHTLRSEFHPTPRAMTGAATTSSPCDSVTPGGHYVGFSVSGFPPNQAPLDTLEHETGVDPNIVSFYLNFGSTINLAPIESLCSRHVLPVLEIDTQRAAQFQQIVDGSDDSILEQYALDVGSLNTPIAIDFDHEFNGGWYKYGAKYVPASEFVAAWRHIVTVFRAYDATNVIWVWNPNTDLPGTAPLAPWYPGNDYVTWIGLDGYLFTARNTYASVFDLTMSQIRAFTDKPVLIVETGAAPASGRERAIASLFKGAAATPGVLGLIWFDYDKAANHNWYINNDAAALAAFGAAAAKYQT
jgi:mannan endo-1,4-beta-mannosidase